MAQFHFLSYGYFNKLQLSKLVLFVFICITFNSCLKDSEEVHYNQIQTNINSDILNITVSDQDTLLSGGFAWEEGFIARYNSDRVTSLYNNEFCFLNCKYDTINDQFIAVGMNGNYYVIDTAVRQFYHSINIETRDVLPTQSGSLIVGGKSYRLGYLAELDGNIEVKKKFEIDRQIQTISFFDNKYYATGFGTILKKGIDFEWEKLEVQGDFFNATTQDTKRLIIAGQNGNLYMLHTNDEMLYRLDIPYAIFINKVRLFNEQLFVLGRDGKLLRYNFINKNWQSYSIEKHVLHDITPLKNGNFLISGANGFLAKINI